MSVATAPALRIAVAAPIRNDPQVFDAVERATDFLRTLIETHRLDPADRELAWACTTDLTPGQVIPVLTERDRYGDRSASRSLSRSYLLDRVTRENSMSALLRDVLEQRWYQVGAVIERGLTELETEESRHAVPN